MVNLQNLCQCGCGSVIKDDKMFKLGHHSHFINLSGVEFGRLIVTSIAKADSGGNMRWNCLCKCGNTLEANGASLRSGDSKSCGCLRDEKATKHGMSPGSGVSREYGMYSGARSRAGKTGIEFSIELQDIHIPERCPYLGIELCLTNKKISYNSPSLDRINSSIGYTKKNIEVISYRANTIKSNASSSELYAIADRLKILGL
jgi:hypothetical protein